MGKLRYVFFILFVLAVFSSCQKDDSVVDVSPPSLKIDSSRSLSASPTPGNALAVKGVLNVTVDDSTYTFDAATDSIAFVSVSLDDKNYFGITAINRAHTMSFGISSPGNASANLISTIAGSQFLLVDANNANVQYTLSQHPDLQNSGKIELIKYKKDSVLVKGTFTTYLSKDAKPNSTFYKAEGSFELKNK